MIPVIYVLAYFVAGLALAMLVPTVVAVGHGESVVALDMLLTAGLTTFLAGAIMLALRGRERRLRPAQRYLLAFLLWLFLPVVAGIPLLLAIEGLSPVHAYFEAVSGLTTTGATVLPPPENLPRGVVLWLAMTQWIGGGVTLLVIILALAPPRVGGLPEAHSRLIEHGGLTEKRRLVLVFRDIFPIYLSATALTFILLAATGLAPFDALCLAFAAVSTGGFSPRSQALGEYVPAIGTVVLVFAMLYGATNVLWHRDLLQLRRSRSVAHRESHQLVAAALVLGGIAGYLYYRAAGHDVLAALRDGLFTAVSLITTSAFEVRNASFEVFPVVLVVILLVVGGAAFSTAGGIKVFRIGSMIVQSGRELNRLVYPHGVRPSKLGGQPYDIQVMKAIWTAFLAFVFAALALSLLLAAAGVPYEGAVLAALSTLSNAGPVYESDWTGSDQWPTFAELPPAMLLGLCLGMILGRLEVVAVLGLLVYAVRR